jgi:hypothetical protein
MECQQAGGICTASVLRAISAVLWINDSGRIKRVIFHVPQESDQLSVIGNRRGTRQTVLTPQKHSETRCADVLESPRRLLEGDVILRVVNRRRGRNALGIGLPRSGRWNWLVAVRTAWSRLGWACIHMPTIPREGRDVRAAAGQFQCPMPSALAEEKWPLRKMLGETRGSYYRDTLVSSGQYESYEQVGADSRNSGKR